MLETNAQIQISGCCVTRNNLNCYSQKDLSQNAITDFLQHTSVKENFAYFDAVHFELSPYDMVTFD